MCQCPFVQNLKSPNFFTDCFEINLCVQQSARGLLVYKMNILNSTKRPKVGACKKVL